MTTDALELTLRREFASASGGDHAAFGRMVQACQNTVTAIALAITRDVQASEDIAQDAFLKAWHHLGRLKNPDSFLPWLRQITRNLARDHLRRQQHRPLTGENADIAISLTADSAPTPGERLLQTEQEAAAAELIAALPEDSREVLLLYYRESQNSRQVASLLGLTDAAVRKRLSRARAYVRDELMRRFGEFASSSAPSAAFVSGVLGAVALSAPPAATAAVLTSGSAVAGKGLLQILGASAGFIALGFIAAVSSVWLGIRKPLRNPLDRDERNALLAYGLFNTGLIVAFLLGTTWLAQRPGWGGIVVLCAGYMGGISWACSRWLPRILKRRREQEMREDPVGTVVRRRRERIRKRVGLVLGLTLGIGALVYGLIASGRLVF